MHNTEVLGRRHTVTRRGIPMSTPARTLCDLTSCCTPPEVERALDDALRRKLLTLRALAAVHRDVAGPGRRRSTVMHTLLDERLPGFDPGRYPKERELVEWIVGAGLPPPVPQHRVRVGRRSFRLDLAYPDLLIGIEYDGWDAHRPRSTFATDRARQNELEVRGWLVLRFPRRRHATTSSAR